VNETGLLEKNFPPEPASSTKEEKTAPAFKAAKDGVTLMSSTNAAGHFKLKPLLKILEPLRGLIRELYPWFGSQILRIQSLWICFMSYHFVPAMKDCSVLRPSTLLVLYSP
jgi:hypothetical protein